VRVESSGLEAVHLSGNLTNISGNIDVAEGAADCVADAGAWTSTNLIQNGGQTFSVGGTIIARAPCRPAAAKV
jgi:hypothetical protein